MASLKKKVPTKRGLKGEVAPRKQGPKPTDEQVAAMDLFVKGGSFAVEAGAGTGKTHTLLLLAEADRIRRGQYVAFNKSIVTEAGGKFPSHVRCNTAHSLAFRDKGREYAHRLNSHRMRSSELASRLRLTSIQFNVGGSPKTLTPAFLAGHVMRTIERYCQTADQEIRTRHFPYIDGIDMPEEGGVLTWDNNNLVSEELIPAARRAWEDIILKDGQLPFKHSHYLKMWQLDKPRIDVDYILYDEVQDAAPVMADVVLRQKERGVQVVLVGDSQQEIYAWMGATNAFKVFNLEDVTYLTQSFRFGHPIADVANRVLETLDTPLRLKGFEPITSRVGPVQEPTAILTRTNASAVRSVLELKRGGRPVSLVGGGKDVLAFARAANDLKMSGYTHHPELACFNTWDEVTEYVEQDPQGSDLKLQYDLVEEFGIETIEEALRDMQKEGDGVVTVSTAHKSKGREWERVVLAPDFSRKNKQTGEDVPLGNEEMRLLYVAVTRARHELDIGLVPMLTKEVSK